MWVRLDRPLELFSLVWPDRTSMAVVLGSAQSVQTAEAAVAMPVA